MFDLDIEADKTGELRNRFLNELVRLLDNYLQLEHKRTSKVLDFHHPHQLKEIMEHCLIIDKDPKSLEEVLSDCKETLKYCVKTGKLSFLLVVVVLLLSMVSIGLLVTNIWFIQYLLYFTITY